MVSVSKNEYITSKDSSNIEECFVSTEDLAKVNQLTSSSVERRLRAKQLELELKDDSNGYVPPKDVLLYFVRMGSFSSSNKYSNEDHEDDDITLPSLMRSEDLLALFQNEIYDTQIPIHRMFLKLNVGSTNIHFRVMQWNILSQTIGEYYDKFIFTPRQALIWKHRRSQMLHEIIKYSPDIICLQEVDHFEFLNKTLSTQGYNGKFYPKPESPCLYVKGNNGPDGCAIFYLKTRFSLIKTNELILPVWTIKSNQVAIVVLLRDNWTNNLICVMTTHLKARPGALMSTIRKEQGRALLEFLRSCYSNYPTVICGDFNAVPTEPVYNLMCNSLNLASVYAHSGKEPLYTTWKIREDGEQCQTLDYIFYTKNNIQVNAVLKIPEQDEIGETRLPSLIYPSDHLSLVCDLSCTS